MPALPALLLAASAFILFALGSLHLWFTFRGTAFEPRDAELKMRMQQVSPRISRQTTMWRAWIGFNASHSFGAMLFGLVYGHLALAQATMLLASPFLLGVGLALLIGYAWLGHRYWFSVPFRSTLVALVLYVMALAANAAWAITAS